MWRHLVDTGIDAAGTVVHSNNEHFEIGEDVLITGCGLSEVRDGGYSEYLPLPDGLTLREAMILGTAGFTAALSLYRMKACGQVPNMGPVVVTGATGGVGSLTTDIFTTAGYEVHAVSGKLEHFEWLEASGATQYISRHDTQWGTNPLERGT